MISLAASLALFASITMGSMAYQRQALRSQALITYRDGRTEQVSVRNSGEYFCPVNCQVHHRHRVHDLRWTCRDQDGCDHFTVFHVIMYGNNSSVSGSQRLNSGVELPRLTDVRP